MNKAVIACHVFYNELAALADGHGIDLQLLPQGLHNYVESEKMMAAIQVKIDELEAKKDYDYIILAYGYCSGGVEGLKAKKAGLVISLLHDCIPMLLGATGAAAGGGIDDGATYYLSRGWIDCGGDSYKEHLFLIEQLDRLLNRFTRYQQENEGAVVLWPEKDQYQQKRRKYSPETAELITYELLKNYRSLTLIDNSNLESIHLEYAREMHSFLNDLLTKHRGEGLRLIIRPGNTELLEKLLFFEQLDADTQKKLFLITAPGEPLHLRKHLLKF